MEAEGIRLNKYLSEAGICSRREADRLIENGKVLVDGQAAVMGMKITPGQVIVCDGKTVQRLGEAPVLLAVHKPKGIVCTTSDKDRAPNIVDLVNWPTRIYPVGRLDKDSEGLILMTNQGDLVNKMMRSGNAHEKEYIVTVDRPITSHFIQLMQNGVPILDTVTRPCKAEAVGEKSFRIILTQGLNRQIRRMCGYLGYQVVSLKRVRIMNIKLGNLAPGNYRSVTGRELEELKLAVRNSTNLPYKDWNHE